MARRVCFDVRSAAIALVMAAAVTTALPAAAQTTIVLDAPGTEVVDTTIQGGSYAATNFANGPLLTRASATASLRRRALLKFNTETTIPRYARITSATLTLTVKEANASTRDIAAYRVTQAFEESEATWTLRKSAYAWTTAGGDLGTKHAQVAVGSTVGAKVKFNITALVQAAVNGNFGSRFTRVALVDVGGTGTELATHRSFFHSEALDPANRPRLSVVFTTEEVPPPAPSAGKLRVLHWNTHHGRGTDNDYDLDRIATWIAKANPDMVTLNEVERFSGAHGNEDQPARYAALLKAKTGRTWYYFYLNAQGGSTGGGSAILSRFPIASKSECVLSSTNNALRVSVVVNGRTVNLFTTHLPPGDSSSPRIRDAAALRACAREYSESRIITGDWNKSPGGQEVQQMLDAYFDSWAEAKRIDQAIDYPGNTRDGATHEYRIDYVFYSKGASLRLEQAQVFNTRGTDGARASDHKPLMATFALQ